MFRYKDETYKIIGAAMSVHKELGRGFLEDVYQEALEIEFKELGIPYEREKTMRITYKGKELTKFYRADFICYGGILVELKALSDLSGDNRAQVLNYMKASNIHIGLLINFGQASLQYERFAN